MTEIVVPHTAKKLVHVLHEDFAPKAKAVVMFSGSSKYEDRLKNSVRSGTQKDPLIVWICLTCPAIDSCLAYLVVVFPKTAIAIFDSLGGKSSFFCGARVFFLKEKTHTFI